MVAVRGSERGRKWAPPAWFTPGETTPSEVRVHPRAALNRIVAFVRKMSGSGAMEVAVFTNGAGWR